MYNFTISVTPADHPPYTQTDTAPTYRNSALHTQLEKNSESAPDPSPDEKSYAQDKCRTADDVGSGQEDMPAPYSSWGGEHAMSVTRWIGLREVELRREKLEDGESFYFIVNGVPIYAKGDLWYCVSQSVRDKDGVYIQNSRAVACLMQREEFGPQSTDLSNFCHCMVNQLTCGVHRQAGQVWDKPACPH